MQTVNDAGLSNSPSARRFDATDEQLSAQLKKWTGASPALHPVGELLDRHWEAAFAYARLCTDGERAAGMLTTAAFTRLFGETLRQNGPTAAWRPHLLVTVRRVAAEWDADGRRDLLHPALRSEAEGEDDDGMAGDRAAALMLPPVHRRMLSRAFQRLPESARCMLWHVEVEAEPLAVPGGLLGLEEDGARVELRRARERLREECLQVHRELATDDECHRYHRLLDVTCRRGGADLDPDLRRHLEQCRHCAHTADQLRQFEGLLGAALAEGILGWAAAAYVEVRMAGDGRFADTAAEPPRGYAGEAFTDGTPAASAFGATSASASASAAAAAPGASRRAAPRPGALARIKARVGGPVDRSAAGADPRPGTSRSAQKAARRARRRNLTAAVLTVSGIVVLPLVVWAALGSGDDTGPGAESEAAKAPATGPDTAASGPSWAGADDDARGAMRGRLRNAASGLCIAVVGDRPADGAETRLATCSAAAGQQWSYEPDGLLRSAADAGLCLDSRLGYSVRLAPCAGAGQPDPRNVRYDFTLQGTLVPRSGQNLALAPAATDGSGALVLKNRVDSAAQRWVIDTSKPDPQMQFVNWGADSTASGTPTQDPTPRRAKSPVPAPAGTPSAGPTAAPAPTPTTGSPSGSDNGSCPSSYPYPCPGGGQPGPPGGYGGSGYGGYGGYGNGYGNGYGYGGYGQYGSGGRPN
ncbi:ricin-type beta-trefoil lectin domain protein [Streptomyces sp. NPDC058291]|uniref:RICIN domain-containing protein n=1 Tax=Streptomyces sp. NPDC058291 TaxID=3346427 RepID=UPI0036E8AAE3